MACCFSFVFLSLLVEIRGYEVSRARVQNTPLFKGAKQKSRHAAVIRPSANKNFCFGTAV
jgi:hypothetical protein